jgi:Zn-dependent protease with chaperone function
MAQFSPKGIIMTELNRAQRLRLRWPTVIILVSSPLWAQPKELKPGFNLFSPQQDIQMGQEASAQVEKTMPVVRNEELNGYLTRLGSRLGRSKHAGTFPFRFSTINDKSINAFALPGGPIYVHTGLLAAVDNESQLAGVLAHEMSHVALRHGSNQASKANLIQLPAALAGTMLGNDKTLWGSLAQLGITLGAESVLLKYSRNAERDADLNGTRIMNDAGYNPLEMARFFEKLEAQGGKEDGLLANWLSDHPSPGNRVKAVEEEIRYLPQNTYSESEPSRLPKVKSIVAGLPAPRKQVETQAGAGAAAPPSIRPSTGYKQYQGKAFTLSYPDNWQIYGEQEASMVTIAPREALVAGANGQTQVGYGVIASFYFPQGSDTEINRETANLIRQLQQGNPTMKRGVDAPRSVQIGSRKGLMTPLESQSPYRGETEMDMLVTVPRPDGLFYLILIAPKSEWADVKSVYDDIVAGVRFPN